MRKTFFIDFDGTITQQDTCDYLTQTFCPQGWQEINALWEQKKITTEECVREIFNLMSISREDIYQLLDTVIVDPFFSDFVKLCEKNQDPIYILSDGYDLHIKYLLTKNNLNHIPFYANKLNCNGDHIYVDFPNINPLCGQCGTCKKELIKSLTKHPSPTLYIGDGYSDFCASQITDIIFAKNRLLLHCQENNIPALKFENFLDIIRWVTGGRG